MKLDNLFLIPLFLSLVMCFTGYAMGLYSCANESEESRSEIKSCVFNRELVELIMYSLDFLFFLILVE